MDLPAESLPQLHEALNIPNLAKQKARGLGEWGWQDQPDWICLYELEKDERGLDHLVMPRGFLEDFTAGIEALGRQVELCEERYWQPLFRAGQKVSLRPWQIPQMEAILKHQQGIVRAPAGSGKTVTILATIRELGCKSIVIVNTKDILWQWADRVKTFLGEYYPVGQVGDGIFEISPYITIATAQTLNSRFDQLERDGFFDEFSFMCLDECHHATANTYNKIINRFSSKYRVGVSATPDKTGDFALATSVLGPVIHVTRPSDVDALTRPRVFRVPTKFSFDYISHKNKWRRSNYPQMISALIRNDERNRLIAETVYENQGHHQLLISKRIEHLENIQWQLEYNFGFTDPIVTIIGRDDNEHRQAATELANREPCLILSTLADEALDIPRLDRLHLPFPQRNPGLVTQQVGRVERVHPDKQDAIIYDYADMFVGVLQKQWKIRRTEVYEARNYAIAVKPQLVHI